MKNINLYMTNEIGLLKAVVMAPVIIFSALKVCYIKLIRHSQTITENWLCCSKLLQSHIFWVQY